MPPGAADGKANPGRRAVCGGPATRLFRPLRRLLSPGLLTRPLKAGSTLDEMPAARRPGARRPRGRAALTSPQSGGSVAGMSADTKSPGDAAPTSGATPGQADNRADSRQNRQAQALRDNLKKRKAQQRRRQSGAEGGAAGEPESGGTGRDGT